MIYCGQGLMLKSDLDYLLVLKIKENIQNVLNF